MYLICSVNWLIKYVFGESNEIEAFAFCFYLQICLRGISLYVYSFYTLFALFTFLIYKKMRFILACS